MARTMMVKASTRTPTNTTITINMYAGDAKKNDAADDSDGDNGDNGFLGDLIVAGAEISLKSPPTGAQWP